MNAAELQRQLLGRFPVENECHEWKEWHSLKSNVSGRKGEDLISYVSALANMDGGCIVIGTRDRTLQPTGIGDFADYTAENLPHRVLGRCPNLSSLGLRIEELRAADTGCVVWVVHVPRHLPRKPVYAHDKAWQRDGDSLVELREERLAALVAEPLLGEDWSATVVAGATVADLDPQALVLARQQFGSRHARERWAADLPAGDSSAEPLASVSLHDEVSEAQLARLLAVLAAAERPALEMQVRQHNERLAAARAPAQRGVPFAPLPLLCVREPGLQGELHLFERDTLGEIMAFDPLRADPRPGLPGFNIVEQSDMFEIYVDQTRLAWRQAQDTGQLSLDAVPTGASEDDLLHWLAGAVRRPALGDAALRRWLVALLSGLLHERGFTLTSLVRARHALAQAAMRQIDALVALSRKRGFEQLTLLEAPAGSEPWMTSTSPEWQFCFAPGTYPARNVYMGRYRFSKHYFDVIHQLKAKGEEFECAKVIDSLVEVKHWVRNIEQQPRFAFWLPTATDYFYPDFVLELCDGRLLVAEYKGEAYATNDDSREKKAVGAAWARAAGGRCLFVMVEQQRDGMDMRQQLRQAMAQAPR